MHVDRENKSAKFWLDPVVALAENHSYSRKELRDIEQVVRENLENYTFAVFEVAIKRLLR